MILEFLNLIIILENLVEGKSGKNPSSNKFPEQEEKFKKYSTPKHESHDHGSIKITLLVIMISLMYSVGNVPYGLYTLLNTVTTVDSAVFSAALITLYTYKSLTILLFYFFNLNYRQIFNEYIKKFRRLNWDSWEISLYKMESHWFVFVI